MRKITILAALVVFAFAGSAQNSDEQDIISTLRAQQDAAKNHKIDAYSDTWRHDPNGSYTFIGKENAFSIKSWDSVYARLDAFYKHDPNPEKVTTSYENYKVKSNGNLAVVEYDTHTVPASMESNLFPYTDETRRHVLQVMEKEGQQWKTSSIVITDQQSIFAHTDHAIESSLNAVGYQFIAAKKYNEAVDVLKLNVKFFPNSYNTYDSLGEAYEDAGDTKSALENYKKSVEMNPKNTNGLDHLTKLKKNKVAP